MTVNSLFLECNIAIFYFLKNRNNALIFTILVGCGWLTNFPLPKCQVRYGPTLAQHRQKFSEDRLPISCRCWNDNAGLHLAANSGPNSGRLHLFSAQQQAIALPNSGFLTSRMVCRGKSDTWPSNVPSMGPTLVLLFSELLIFVEMKKYFCSTYTES